MKKSCQAVARKLDTGGSRRRGITDPYSALGQANLAKTTKNPASEIVISNACDDLRLRAKSVRVSEGSTFLGDPEVNAADLITSGQA